MAKKARVMSWTLTKADGSTIEVPHEEGMTIASTLPGVEPKRFALVQHGWLLHDNLTGWTRVRCEPCASEGRHDSTLCVTCEAAC